MFLVDAAAGVLFTAAVLWAAYVVACRLTRNDPASVRVCAGFVVLVWALSAGLLVLSALRLFTAVVAILLAIAAAVAAQRIAARNVDPRMQLEIDIAAARAWWASMTPPFRILLGMGAVILLVRTVHGLVAPSLAWDALTYHLYKPAVWAQSRGIVSTAGPDAAGYYTWFPPYGDGLWAWWLLVMHGDLANAPIALATSLLIPAGCYASARALNATVFRSTAAGLALVFTPAVLSFGAAVYVDNLAIALFVAGTLFLIRLAKQPCTADAVLAAAAFAILGGVKGTAVPVAALGIVATIVLAKAPSRAIAAAAVAIPAVIPSLLAWVGTGSPVYPVALRFGTHVIFRGNPELEQLLRGEWLTPRVIADARPLFWARMFLPWHRQTPEFMNLGLGALVILPAVLPGALALWRSKPARHVLVFLVLAAVLTVAALAGDASLALRVAWWGVIGRLVGIALAAAVLIAAAWRTRFCTALLWTCAFLGIVVGWPRGVGAGDVHALLASLRWLVPIIAVTWIAARLFAAWRIAVVAIAAIAIVASTTAVRDRFRYEFYEEAQALNSYDVHPLDSAWMASWPAWQRLDDGVPHTIAVTAGWDGTGHNWYRYPIMGRRLQNRLLYIPITQSGALIDYAQNAPAAPMSCGAWLRRLLSSSAEYLLVLPPEPPEAEWAPAVPAVLVPEMELDPPGTVLYRIVRSGGSPQTCENAVKIP